MGAEGGQGVAGGLDSGVARFTDERMVGGKEMGLNT